MLDLSEGLYREISESGLVSLAVDPDFATHPHVYTVRTIPPSGAGRYIARVARFTWDGTRLDPASERVILEVLQFDITHSVNHAAFGADGMLYVSLGDQRATGVNAQDPSRLPGKILRLDVRAGDPYAVPSDNPSSRAARPRSTRSASATLGASRWIRSTAKSSSATWVRIDAKRSTGSCRAATTAGPIARGRSVSFASLGEALRLRRAFARDPGAHARRRGLGGLRLSVERRGHRCGAPRRTPEREPRERGALAVPGTLRLLHLPHVCRRRDVGFGGRAAR